MITEISPIFGLSLLGLVELAVIVGAFVGIVSSLIIARTIHKRNVASLEQQRKVNSAELTLKLLEWWDGINTFTKLIFKLSKPNAKFTDEEDGVFFALTKFEAIAILLKDKTLTENHVREFFGMDLVRINANESIRRILDEYHQEDIDHNYNNLKELLDESKKWGMHPYSSEELSSD